MSDKVFNIRRLVDFLACASAEEIRNSEDFPAVGSLLSEYADLLEAQEKAEPVGEVMAFSEGSHQRKHVVVIFEDKRLDVGTKLCAYPPATPASTNHQFPFEAACSGLRYESPEACGEVSAIHINGKRWPLSDLCKEKQAPVVDERAEFEKWASEAQSVNKMNCYEMTWARAAFAAGQARAKLGQTTDKVCSAVVPDERRPSGFDDCYGADALYNAGWNDCRAAMLKVGK